MKIINQYLRELEDEAPVTKKMLERIPGDKWDWKPHHKSMDVVTLSNHIAELPYWVDLSLHRDFLDFADAPYQPTSHRDIPGLIAYMDKGLEEAKESLKRADDDLLKEKWILKTGDEIHWETTKGDAVRMSLSQIIHHRAQLGVFLRLLDVPIPGSYGPSADEA